jgi:hypothetical protein
MRSSNNLLKYRMSLIIDNFMISRYDQWFHQQNERISIIAKHYKKIRHM